MEDCEEMKTKKISFNHKGKKLYIDARVCNLFLMFKGLMFTRREKAEALLLFDFKKPLRMKIHSWFVFYSFVAVWLDDKGNIVEKKLSNPSLFVFFPKSLLTN